jgi:hypothetical protein
VCWYVKVFVPDTEELVRPRSGDLVVEPGGPRQLDFERRHRNDNGAMLTVHRGQCLCDFGRWRDLFRLLGEIQLANRARWVEALLFWEGHRYRFPETLLVDPDNPGSTVPLEGQPLRIRCRPHRALSDAVGHRVVVTLVDGRTMHGVLEDYDTDAGFAKLQSGPGARGFSSRRVFAVSRLD